MRPDAGGLRAVSIAEGSEAQMGDHRGDDSQAGVPHLRPAGTSKQLMVDGKPFIMLGGEVHNSSSSSLAYMEWVWDRLAALHCNTALVPVSWELLEPREGEYDFTLVDGLVGGAREHGLRLVVLWFGTWKNAASTYAPAWVKTDLERFPRAQREPGRNSNAVSCVSEEACRADARAFAALMRRLGEIDGQEHTVVMVQVENEVGLLGAGRDHSAAAEQRFREAVPEQLMGRLRERKDALLPELGELWAACGERVEGTWPEVFGQGADEVFMAWHVGRYVDRVAEAGQAAYGLPMFANAWLVQYEGQAPGEYPSGGPVARMMDVWQAAAPHIALLAPDIYLPDFAGVCAEYTRGGNALLIPEARRDEGASANAFYALGQHDALGFAPFGIEDVAADGLLASAYQVLSGMLPVIAEHHGRGATVGVLESEGQIQEVELGGYRLRIRFGGRREPNRLPGGGLIIATAADEYVVAGHGFSVDFLPRAGEPANVDFLALDEGTYQDGEWTQGRRLNGDEYRLRLRGEPGVRRAKVYSHV